MSKSSLPQEPVRPLKTDVFSVYIHKTPKVSCHDRTQQILVLGVLKQCLSVFTSRIRKKKYKTDVLSVCTHKTQNITWCEDQLVLSIFKQFPSVFTSKTCISVQNGQILMSFNIIELNISYF